MIAYFDPLVDLVLPRRCVGCRRPGSLLCSACLPPRRALFVPLGPLLVTAAVPYAGTARQAVVAYKERGRRDLAGVLARLLALAIALVAPAGGLLVPVPSTRAAAAGRGGDHIARLARKAARSCGCRVATGALSFTRQVRDSAGLDVAARAANLSGALRARAGPPIGCAHPVVLVDDIVTTGATLREAQRALSAAGWQVAGAAVVAATELRHARPAL